MDDKIYRYITAHSNPESEALAWIRRQTNLKTNHARMLSGPVQGQLLTILTQISGARRALEIGTFTGYASVCIACGLPADGHLDTLEINDELDSLIHAGWERAGVSGKITLHTGPALETIGRLRFGEGVDTRSCDGAKLCEGERAKPCSDEPFIPYDLVYIDANKREYCAYYEAVLPLVRPGGLILADNTLWDGKILEDPLPQDAQTVEIARFNDLVASDPRVDTVILPLRDGLTILRVK